MPYSFKRTYIYGFHTDTMFNLLAFNNVKCMRR